MKTLPLDVMRCSGKREADGDLAELCAKCARNMLAFPCGERTPWTSPMLDRGTCAIFMPMDES